MTNKNFKKGFTIILILISFIINAQNQKKIDSLFTVLKTAKADTTRVNTYAGLCMEYANSNPDTALYFGDLGLKLAIKTNFKKGMPACYLNIGIVHRQQGRYDQAIEYLLKSLKIDEELQNKKEMSACYTNIGIVYYYQGSYDKAIEYYFKSLKIDEESGDKKGMFACYIWIGNIHYSQRSLDKAIEYYFKSLKIIEESGDKNGMSYCYNNIGMVYSDQGLYDKALDYYLKSLKIFEESGDKKGMSKCYNNVGNVHYSQGAYDKAVEYYLKSLKIKEELGDKNGIALIWGNIAELQITLADSVATTQTEKIKHYNEAVKYGLKSLNLAKEIKALPLQNQIAAFLLKAYKALGKPIKALEYAEIFIATKDSMFSEEKTKALAEMGAKYESEKKQLEIEKMQKQKELDNKTMEAQTAENRKQQIIIFSAVGGFLIVLVFSVIILRMFRQKRKANILLATQNAEIRLQKEEISAQRDEIETQRDTVVLQKDHIEEQKKEITDSITYAKRIQQAILPDLNRVLSRQSPAGSLQIGQAIADCGLKTADYFVLYKPKDIVSGDFYWGTRINEWLIVTVADCTGHGVPGAFMSMLGVSFLNEIVRKKEIIKASEILDNLRVSIIEALQQRGTPGEQKDGMDIIICIFNTLDNTLQFAGANNPLYIIKGKDLRGLDQTNNLIQQDLGGLVELRGDNQPVAIYENMKPFTNHIIQLQKGDTIYLTSDGYEDQFGGPDNKKFKSKQLKELFVNIADKPMDEQKEILDTTFENWRGEHEQIDDVTVLGLKI